MNNKMKKMLQGVIRKMGYEIRWLPRLIAENPEAELKLTLEHIVSTRLLRTADFFFVQVGAFDGECGDPIHELLSRHQLRGIMVEPQPATCEALARKYAGNPNITVVQAAITRRSGRVVFYQPGGDSILASLDRQLVLRSSGCREQDIRELEVPGLTLDDLIAKYGVDHIDLLQIDAEGHDFEVLQSLSLDRVRPAIINYEHSHLPAGVRDGAWEFLVQKGYRLFIHQPDTTAVAAAG